MLVKGGPGSSANHPLILTSAFIWTNAELLSTRPLRKTNFSEILVKIQTVYFDTNIFEKTIFKMVANLALPQNVNIWKYFK